MLEDVLANASLPPHDSPGLLVVTIDATARHMALRYGARLVGDGARDGDNRAVAAAARMLAAEGRKPTCRPCPVTSRWSPPTR